MVAKTRMHLTIFTVVIAVMAISSAGCTSNQVAQSGVPSSFLLYTNKDAGVEMYYPSDWQLTGGSAAGSVAQLQNNLLTFQITRGKLNNTGQTAQSLAKDYVKNVTLLENQSTSLGGLPAYTTVIKFKVYNETYKLLTIFAIKGNYFYRIQYNGPEAQYDTQNATVQQMLSSFKFE